MPRTDPYIREGWVGYRVVFRFLPVDKRSDEEIMRAQITGEVLGRGISQGMSINTGQYNSIVEDVSRIEWHGPVTVVAETDINWVLRNDEGLEVLARKDGYIFLSVGDEEA